MYIKSIFYEDYSIVSVITERVVQITTPDTHNLSI